MLIYEMTRVTEAIYVAFVHLIPQLTSYSAPPSQEELETLASCLSSFVFLAENEEREIVGTATLALAHSPTGVHGWIEDVVVAEAARRQGIGKALTLKCLDKARSLGLREVNLTSRPGRQAANRLYQDLGFIQRETNVYQYPLD